MKHKYFPAIISVFSLLFSTFLPNVTLASVNSTQSMTQSVQKSPIESIMDKYGVSFQFVEGELNKGYFFDEIQKALEAQKKSGQSYKDAIQSIHPLRSSVKQNAKPVSTPGPNVKKLVMDDLTKNHSKGSVSLQHPQQSSISTNSLTTLTTTSYADTSPLDLNQTLKQAPYAIPDTNYSTLNGAVLGEFQDMVINGKNGLGFALKRGYDSSEAQLFDVNYSTMTTKTKYDQTVSMLGMGWRWEIPSLEMASTTTVKAIHMADGGQYAVGSGNTLTSYPFKDLTLKSDTSETSSSFSIMSTNDHIRYFFDNRGQLIKMKDPFGNYVSFKYGSAIDPITYLPISATTLTKSPLNEIDTSNGNSIKINYCPKSTTATTPCTSTDQQVVISSGNRSVVYKVDQYKDSNNNNMLLLSSVTEDAGDSKSYQTQFSYWYYNARSYKSTSNKYNPYQLLKRIVYPTGATSNYVYGPDDLINYVPSTSTIASENDVYELQETYKTLSEPDVDPFTYNGTKYNDVKISFNGNMTKVDPATSTFSVTEVSNGESKTTYRYLKASKNNIPYYHLDETVKDDKQTLTQTDYTYSQLKDDKTTTVTNYSNPNLVTVSKTLKSNPDQILKYYSNTNYTDFGEVRDKAAPTLKTPPLNATVTTDYDPTNRWVTTTKECLNQGEGIASCTNEKITNYTHDSNTGTVLSFTVQDQSNKILRQQSYRYEKDTSGNITGNVLEQDIQDGSGNNVSSTTYTYDTDGSLSSSSTALKNGTSVKTSYHYDKLSGVLLFRVDGNGYKTSYTYDLLGRLTSIAYPDNTRVTLTYDVSSTSNDLLAAYTYTDPNTSTTVTNRKTKLSYDPIGQKTSEYQSAGTDLSGNDNWVEQGSFKYDEFGHVTSDIGPTGVETHYQFDLNGRPILVTHNYSRTPQMVESYEYDDVNLTQTHTDTDGSKQQTKTDILGNKIEVDSMNPSSPDQIDQVLARNVYNLVGNVVQNTDANKNVNTYQYDALSELTSVKTQDNVETNYQYDTRGLQVSTNVTSDNSRIQNTYDELGHLVQTLDGEGKKDSYTYDGNGNLKTHIDNNNQVTAFTYDAGDRLLNKTLTKSDGTSETVSYTYDNQGRKVTMTDGTGTTSYAYTYLNMLDHIDLPDGRTTSFEYDTTGTTQTGMTDPFGQNISYKHDIFSRISEVSLDNSTTPEASYSYTNGILTQKTEGNNISFSNTYDQLGRLEQVSGAGATDLTTYKYSYDGNGNITEKSDNVGTYAFTYDQQNRITKQSMGESNDTYSYDVHGNRLTITSSNPVLPQLNKYQYDGSNQLVSVATQDGSTVTYRYNGDGLLYERTDSKGTTRYYYDDVGNVIADASVVDNTATLNARYIRGVSGELIAREDSDGNKAYYTLNGHGDVTELRDSSGKVLNQYYYDIWGNPVTSTETVENPFRYSGELWDNVTHLLYLKARWYDPAQGRFINPDTVKGNAANPQSLNLYTYVQNNPLTNSDPTGHYCVSDDGKWAHGGDCNSSTGNYLGDDSDYQGSDIIQNGLLTGYLGRMGPVVPKPENYWNSHTVERLLFKDHDKDFIDEYVFGSVEEIPLLDDPIFYLADAGVGVIKATAEALGKSVAEIIEKVTVKEVSESIAKEVQVLKPNNIHHILNASHDWSKLVENPNDWNQIAAVISKVFKEGVDARYKKTGTMKVLRIGDETVEVTYRKLENGRIAISDAWVAKKN